MHEPLVVAGESRAIDWLDQAVKEIPAFAKLLELSDDDKIDLVIITEHDVLALCSAVSNLLSGLTIITAPITRPSFQPQAPRTPT